MVLCLLVLCSICAQVSANDPPKVIITKSPASPVIGETIVLDATGSSDPEGGTLTFLWTFVDEGIEKSGPSVTYSYSTEGTKTVLLTVTDDQGHITLGAAKFLINPSAPEKPTSPLVTVTTAQGNETSLNLTPITPKANPIITMVPTTVLISGASGQSTGATGSGSNQGSGSAPANASPAGPPYIMYMIVGAVVLVGVVLGGIVFVKRQR
jgi:PKD repeat protein